LERYGYLGGLSTGGLVILIDRLTDLDGRQVISGCAREILERLARHGVAVEARADWGSKDPALNAYWRQRLGSFRDTVTWSPVIDPEWLKLESLRMSLDLGVRLCFHSWAVAPIIDGRQLQGVVFESKEGRQAIY